jgi:hypothetical protein
MTGLRGRGGSRCDPAGLGIPSRSALASADRVTTSAPWPEAGAARGPLAWSDHELADVIRGITFPVLTPEAQRENQFLEALESGVFRDAFESGAIKRKKPGRRPGKQERRRDLYLALYLECLAKNERNVGLADVEFIKRAPVEFNITPPTARNRLSEVKKRLSTERL